MELYPHKTPDEITRQKERQLCNVIKSKNLEFIHFTQNSSKQMKTEQQQQQQLKQQQQQHTNKQKYE